jgi:hypothetical protein
VPYAAELVRVARKVVWYDSAEQTLSDSRTFLTHLMIYGSPAGGRGGGTVCSGGRVSGRA